MHKPVELVWRLFKYPGTKAMKFFFNNKRQKEKGAFPSTVPTVPRTQNCARVVLHAGHERMTGVVLGG